jgi:hypothetical protein
MKEVARMRVVELHLEADRPIDLVLHARLTVLVADEAAARRIVEVLGRAYVLAGSEARGTLDAGGYLTPLDPTAVVALDLPGEGLRVLGVTDLVPPDPARREGARAAARAEVDRLQPLVDGARARIDHARRRHEATLAAVAAGHDEMAATEERRTDLDTATSALEQRPPEIDRERAAATEALQVARARVDELRAVRSELAELLGPAADASHLRMGDDTAALSALVDRAAAVGGTTPEAHQDAVTWLAAVTAGTAPVHPTAAALVRDSAEIEAAWEQAASAGVEGDTGVVAATAHRDALAEQRDLLDRLSRSGLLGDTAKSEIEAARTAAQAASGADRDRAVAAEDEALSRYGFDSYLDFTIATSTRSVGQKAQAKLATVTDDLAAAEEALVAARDAAAANLERLAEAREPARRRIADYLGFRPEGPAEPHLTAVPEVPTSVAGLLGGLDDATVTAQDEVRRYGEVLQELDEERASLDVRRGELATQRAHIEHRLSEIQALLLRAEPEVPAAAGRLEEALDEARALEAQLAVAVRTCEELDDADDGAYTGEDVPAVIDGLLSRLDPWAPNPHPVVLHDTLAPLGAEAATTVLMRLVEGAPRSQLVYVTEDRSLLEWARSLDPSVGAAVELARPRWLQRRLARRAASRQRG